jgi:GTPase involved in cell partitioning and DNA repair
MQKRMIPFPIEESTNWDGYFIDVERNNPRMTQPEKTRLITDLNQYCVTKDTFIVVNRIDSVSQRIEMYVSA